MSLLESRLARGLGNTAQHFRQRTALNKFHREERPTFVVADVVDLNNVIVVQARDGLSLTLKPFSLVTTADPPAEAS